MGDQQQECTSELQDNEVCDEICNSEEFNFDNGNCCDKNNLGNDVCNPECFFEKHEFDKGDCCEEGKIGNDNCDPECLFAKNGFDGGDCCNDPALIGDGTCHQGCLLPQFNYDHGDCCASTEESCFLFRIDNGEKDDSCNKPACGFDGGDFLQDKASCFVDSPSDECRNILSSCTIATKGECKLSVIGDGFCDSACNIDLCENDGGDCQFRRDAFIGRIALVLCGVALFIGYILFVTRKILTSKVIHAYKEEDYSKYEGNPASNSLSAGDNFGESELNLAAPSERHIPQGHRSVRDPQRRQIGRRPTNTESEKSGEFA